MLILDLGSGRNWLNFRDAPEDTKVVCVDRGYGETRTVGNVCLAAANAFEFLPAYNEEPFDLILASRIFEHFAPEEVFEALWHCWRIAAKGCLLTIIVPDHLLVAHMVGALNPLATPAIEFQRKFSFAHFEFFNTPDDPHLSIWTPNLVPYYLETENLWKVKAVEHVSVEPGRDFFLKISALRVEGACVASLGTREG